MRTAVLSLCLTEDEQRELAERYHFDQAGLARMTILYQAVLPLLRPQTCFTIREQKVFCVVTLGAGIDQIQEKCSREGALLDAYILDCIGSFLLEKAYQQINMLVFKESGLFLQDLSFPGSDLPITKMQEILQNLTNKLEKLPISCNMACVLTPKKSVVFMAGLGEKRQDCGICAMCSRVDCENRR